MLHLGPGAYFAMTDIEIGFCIIPVNPRDHNLMAFKSRDKYYDDACLPMCISFACALFEHFSILLQSIAKNCFHGLSYGPYMTFYP